MFHLLDVVSSLSPSHFVKSYKTVSPTVWISKPSIKAKQNHDINKSCYRDAQM